MSSTEGGYWNYETCTLPVKYAKRRTSQETTNLNDFRSNEEQNSADLKANWETDQDSIAGLARQEATISVLRADN